MALFVTLCAIVLTNQAQVALEWLTIDAAPMRPTGYSVVFDQWLDQPGFPARFSVDAASVQPQARDNSGTDWWYAHVNLAEGGYIAVGYTSYVNWRANDGCLSPPGTH